jgi:hypothetical protein
LELRRAGIEAAHSGPGLVARSRRARSAQHWNFGGSPEEFARKRDVLYAHCHDIGRDPKEIMLSSHIRLGADGDAGPVVDTAAALGELVGLEYTIVAVTSSLLLAAWGCQASGGDLVLIRKSAEDLFSADPVLAEVDLRWPGVRLSRRSAAGIRLAPGAGGAH